jgi:transcriptional regulator with XRE-family HTH domain
MGQRFAPLFPVPRLFTSGDVLTISRMKTTTIAEGTGNGLREVLQCELARRCALNPQYSLRGFARVLGIDHSTLSQILRQKRRLTEDTIRRLACGLSLSEDEIQRFILHEECVGREGFSQRHVRQLQAEAVEVISQWHHFAILELTRLDCFQPDSRWIARVLDITVDDVNMAITRLLHLGLLQMVDHTKWRDTSEIAFARLDHLPLRVARELTARIARLESTSCAGDRLLSSSTVAVDRNRLGAVAGYLERVRNDLAELLRIDGLPCNDVYQLDILFYPLTNLHQEIDRGSTRDAIPDPRQSPPAGR